MIKCGFTIIELLISMFIASILSVSLTNYLNQVYTFQTIMTNIIDADTRANMVTSQLEADLMGIFVPFENLQTETDKEKKENTTEKNKPSQETIIEASTRQEKKEKQIQPYENIFLAQAKDKQLNVLSMISTNALNVYWSETVGKPKPNITRIIYRIIPDQNNKQSFMLTRREQKNLNYQPYKDEKQLSDEYVLADGIKELIITYHAQPQPTDDQDAESITSTQQAKYIKAHIWQWPKKNVEQEQEKKEDIILPNMVTLELILWNEQYNRSTPFTYAINIPYQFIMTDVSEKIEPKNKKQPEIPTQQGSNGK